MRFNVTVCWHETVEVKADSAKEALDKALLLLDRTIVWNGQMDKWEIEEAVKYEDPKTRQC